MKILITLLLLLGAGTLPTAAAKSTTSGLCDVGGFKLYMECYTSDKPTLILEQGFGRAGSDGAWSDNIIQLKQLLLYRKYLQQFLTSILLKE